MPPGDGFLEDISTHNLTRRLTDYLLEGDILLCISTHSLTRRLTECSMIMNYCGCYFNSQPHKEADVIDTETYNRVDISTHSLTRRLTSERIISLILLKHFNSQPHKEADDTRIFKLSIFLHFNSQPHKEADCISK